MKREVLFFNPEATDADLDRAGERLFTRGHEAWTLLPCRELQRRGHPCRVVRELPATGVVVAHRDHLGDDVRPRRGRVLVCARADRLPHQSSTAEIVVNASQARHSWLQPAFHLPHYPLATVEPRDPGLPHRVRNLAYIGNPENLAPELQSPPLLAWMADNGFALSIQLEPGRWGALADADALLAIRDFDGRPWSNKPATKLFNAWQAGIPALVGPETAYLATGRDGVDCLVVRRVGQLREALLALRADPALWRRLVDNGRARFAAGFTIDRVTDQWEELLWGRLAGMDSAVRWAGTAARAWARRTAVALRR